MSRVTVLGTLPPLKGVSAYNKQLLTALLERMPVDFIGFRKLYPAPLFPGGSPEEHDDDVFTTVEHPDLRKWEHLTWWNPVGWVRAGFRVATPVLHAHWWTWALFPPLWTVASIARRRGAAVVWTVHNVIGHESGRLDRALTRRALGTGDRWIVHSSANAEQLIARYGMPADRVSVIPRGVYDFYLTGGVERAAARERLGLPPVGIVFLAFGHIRRYKGVGVLLAAFRRVLDTHPDASLVLAGRPWTDWAPFDRTIAADPLLRARVRLRLDYIPSADVEQFFRAADALVLPYLEFESQSGPGNIALASGLPVVASRIGGLPDLVVDDGLLVEPGDVDGLARALVLLADDPARLARAAAATRDLADRTSWGATIERTVALYDLLGDTGRRT